MKFGKARDDKDSEYILQGVINMMAWGNLRCLKMEKKTGKLRVSNNGPGACGVKKLLDLEFWRE